MPSTVSSYRPYDAIFKTFIMFSFLNLSLRRFEKGENLSFGWTTSFYQSLFCTLPEYFSKTSSWDEKGYQVGTQNECCSFCIPWWQTWLIIVYYIWWGKIFQFSSSSKYLLWSPGQPQQVLAMKINQALKNYPPSYQNGYP